MIKNFRREVTDSSFARAFDEYLSKRILNNNGEDTDETDEGFKVLDKINKQEGLTREEVDSYINKYPIFSEFYDEEGFELELETPNYKTYKPTVTDNMSIDEKLAEIANLIENLLKKKGNFVQLDYSQVCFGYVTNEMITNYRKQMQCFRHATDNSIAERKNFTEDQKNFLVDYGLTIVKVIYALAK